MGGTAYSETYTYNDSDGSLNTMTTGVGTTLTMGYDGLRRLSTVTGGPFNRSYAYRDISGTATTLQVSQLSYPNGVNYQYYYAGGKLMRMTWGSDTIDFFYDANGAPYAMKYNGTVYYYVTNLQGDVMRIVNASGTVMASYDYDPYGKVISATGTLANINPLRYRGYIYDTEAGFYYLQSRYYDPAVGRFLNADSYASTGQDIIGYNMFAYCGNSPIMFIDNSGTKYTCIEVIGGGLSRKKDVAVIYDGKTSGYLIGIHGKGFAHQGSELVSRLAENFNVDEFTYSTMAEFVTCWNSLEKDYQDIYTCPWNSRATTLCRPVYEHQWKSVFFFRFREH